jgi:hypothetical protein
VKRGQALGLPAGGAFPFLVEGPVSHVQWHVADGSKLPPGPSSHEEHAKAAVHGMRDHVTATLLGFYSDHDMGNWLHHDSNVHVHALLPGGLAAHLDDVTLEPGAVLRLPSAWRDLPGLDRERGCHGVASVSCPPSGSAHWPGKPG